jgi:hypothetical protein
MFPLSAFGCRHGAARASGYAATCRIAASDECFGPLVDVEELRADGRGTPGAQRSGRFGLADEIDPPHAVDVLMFLMSPTSYQTFVGEYGWLPGQVLDHGGPGLAAQHLGVTTDAGRRLARVQPSGRSRPAVRFAPARFRRCRPGFSARPAAGCSRKTRRTRAAFPEKPAPLRREQHRAEPARVV